LHDREPLLEAADKTTNESGMGDRVRVHDDVGIGRLIPRPDDVHGPPQSPAFASLPLIGTHQHLGPSPLGQFCGAIRAVVGYYDEPDQIMRIILVGQ
jgi:hypothetical protein